jgi:DNA-binding protein HU-beta
MNKKQLIAKLSGSLNLSKADAERTFDTITNTILVRDGPKTSGLPG